MILGHLTPDAVVLVDEPQALGRVELAADHQGGAEDGRQQREEERPAVVDR